MAGFTLSRALAALCCGFLALAGAAAEAQAQDGLLITEFMAFNQDFLKDKDQEYSDWLEIYNAGAQEVNLEGYHLTDSADLLQQWTFPAVTLPPAQFLLVFCSGKDYRDPAGELHTNFKLEKDGESVLLIAPDLSRVSSYDFPEQAPNASYGMATDSSAIEPVAAGSQLRFHVPADGGLGLQWTGLDFDDATWKPGTSAVGYGGREPIATDVGADMTGINASMYIRIPFEVPDPAGADVMTLRVKYDDGYVAFLNGQQIASGNAPATLAWNSQATKTHASGTLEQVNVSAHVKALRPGKNVLAIQALNQSPASNDLYLLPELEIVDVKEVLTNLHQYFPVPTPRYPNGAGFLGMAPRPTFSHESAAYTGPQSVAITTSMPGATIRYTTDGSVPSESSLIYSAPVEITGVTRLTARVYRDGLFPGPPVAKSYVILHTNVQNFNSNLPLVICTTFGKPLAGCGSATYTPGNILIIEPGDDRALITGKAQVAEAAGFRRRGSSTCGDTKFSFNVEFWDEESQDKDVEVFDFPIDSDYIIFSPYNFDHALMRNPLAYWMSRECGRWAARSRFVEVFFHQTAGPLSTSSYHGLCSFMEKNKRHPDKVDVAQIGPQDNAEPEVTGGYILKRDRIGSGETSTSAGGYDSLVFVYPKQPTAAQRTYITGFLNQAINSLNPNIGKQEDTKLIDVLSFIDHHILNWYPKNVDAFRLSGYFFKNRNGLMEMGPVWDYDRTMGCDDDGRAATPTGWENDASGDGGTQYFLAGGMGSWYSKLFLDPIPANRNHPVGNSPWAVAYRARWRELRQGPLRTEHIMAQIDLWAEEIREAADRNFKKWTGVPPRFGGFQGEVNHLKNWLTQRADWIDAEFISMPYFTPDAGLVAKNTQVEIKVDSGSPIYYTVDGSDPKGPTSEPSPTAALYKGPITIVQNTKVVARAYEGGGLWSGSAEALFVTDAPKLMITEIMYNPTKPTAVEDPTGRLTATTMEFIEIKNIGAEDAPLAGVRFSAGVTFTFDSAQVKSLKPGELVVVVADPNMFAARYGAQGILVAGKYTGNLSDRGEKIKLLGPLDTMVHFDFSYSAEWYPETNGGGFSLVNVDPAAPPDDLGQSTRWKASSAALGNPGANDSSTSTKGLQRPGDLSQDGRVNITDALVLLLHIAGEIPQLPCEEDPRGPGNVALADFNGDGLLDIADAIAGLNHLFKGGPPHLAGTACVGIQGCRDSCTE